jgi:hypothetical protein
MFKWLKAYFAVDNNVNEHTVIGTLFSVALFISIFTGAEYQVIWTLSGMVLAFFGLGTIKK